MNSKEKAKELVESYFYKIIEADRLDYNTESFNVNIAKQCALIAVDEIIEAMQFEGLTAGYWQEVKTEIEKL